MKNSNPLFFAILLLIGCAMISCRKGCNDCNAINYREDLKHDQSTCVYTDIEQIGTYQVVDTTYDWLGDTYVKEYEIQLKHAPCMPGSVILQNYHDLTNGLTGAPLEVLMEIRDDSINIPYQFIEGDEIPGESFSDFEIYNKSGYFSGDSIYFPIGYNHNNGDPTSGRCYGVKID